MESGDGELIYLKIRFTRFTLLQAIKSKNVEFEEYTSTSWGKT